MKGWVLVLGGSSAIVRATTAELAQRGYDIYLAGRDPQELSRDAADLMHRHQIDVAHAHFDADRMDAFDGFFRQVLEHTGGIAGVVLGYGYLGGQALAAQSDEETLLIIERNFTSAARVLNRCAAELERQQHGFIIGIGSVAGDRGRQSNYTYGAAKGALSLYLEGLRNRLFRSGVKVLTVKPGFVDTAMTFGLPGMFLVASPQYVGARIVRALEKGRHVIYVPWFWRYIMLIIRHIPETIFKRLSL